jgi:hypothetical protein
MEANASRTGRAIPTGIALAARPGIVIWAFLMGALFGGIVDRLRPAC